MYTVRVTERRNISDVILNIVFKYDKIMVIKFGGMKMKEQFTNMYPISKTLRFSLIPVGKTEENFNNKMLLETDKQRAEDYSKVKKIIDRYHKTYIESVLSSINFIEGVDEYASLYYKNGKDDNEIEKMEELEASMRKFIAKKLTSDKRYKDLSSAKTMIESLLPEFVDAEEKEIVSRFHNFSTYFSGFFTNRENMYSDKAQSTAVSYRCINDNLPRFLDNCRSFEKIKASLSPEKIEELNELTLGFLGKYMTDAFSVDFFPYVLSQRGIDLYNSIIGGYTCEDTTKVQGINEIINLYNQQVAKGDKSKKLPSIKPLYKQILSDKESVSFIPEKYKNDDAVIFSVLAFYRETVEKTLPDIKALFDKFGTYNHNGIFISSGIPVTDLSNAAFGSWSAFTSAWNDEYMKLKPLKKGKNPEKYEEEMKAEFKKAKSFSVADFQRLGSVNKSENSVGSVSDYYVTTVSEKTETVYEAYKKAEGLLTSVYSEKYDKKLMKNETAIALIKELLDAVKDLEKTIKPLIGTGKEENKDELFYGEFIPLYDALSSVDRLYDKVRNYMTQKPYSTDKIKLNFDNPQLLGGWDRNKEKDYRTVLMRRNGLYYLAIMDKSNNKIFESFPESASGDCYEKMDYKLLPGPNKMLPKVFFAASNASLFQPSDEILKIRSSESFKKGQNFNVDDCRKFIDFFKDSINKHDDWSKFGFKFSDTKSYSDISEFYNEIKEQGYMVKFRNIPVSYIEQFVENGQLYLFQIYNKDFSEYSHGTPNMHTLYFKMLFDERNLKDVVFKLNGEAEMFYREASIKDSERIVHPANQPVKNKNPESEKSESIFNYDLIKDKRFTKRQFSIHIPITLNFKAEGREFINPKVRLAVKNSDSGYVIGIDRGERNLIYISVINGNGEIVEQTSLNEIISDNGYKVNYQNLLDRKEKEHDEARKSWGSVENIKELKEGYLSQVVHKICELVVKYDAIIAMEDLNSGFKNSRIKVEKQVYQKFENMLISKLNYLADKKAEPDSEGGILNAYQLTNKYDGTNKGKQNGIIFYVSAWLTSKIDPITGFADLLKPKYTSVEAAHDFFEKIDSINYNESSDMFEFDIDYDKFPRCNADFRKKWTVCTNGNRIKTFRNPKKNSEWDNKTVCLTAEFKKLFDEYGIDYSGDIKAAVLRISNKDFCYRLIGLIQLTLQMRNSITGSTNPEDDYLISPVRNASGGFYDSREYQGSNASLPTDADANGAFNIARKGLWAIEVLKNTPDDGLDKADLSITNAKWLEYAQK